MNKEKEREKERVRKNRDFGRLYHREHQGL